MLFEQRRIYEDQIRLLPVDRLMKLKKDNVVTVKLLNEFLKVTDLNREQEEIIKAFALGLLQFVSVIDDEIERKNSCNN